jgi:DNA-directed RNA polymerase subunit RPC12/RpoP
MSNDYRLPEARCPQCDYKLDAATIAHGEDSAPSPGDCSFCLNCGQVLIYSAELIARKPTAQEIHDLMENAEQWAVIEKAQRFIEKRGRYR